MEKNIGIYKHPGKVRKIYFWTISAARYCYSCNYSTISYLSNSGAAIAAFVSLVLCAMCMLHAGTKLQSTTFITVSLLQPKQILICWFYDASFSTLVWPIDMLYFICMHVWWKLRLMHFLERCSYLHTWCTVQATLLKAYFGKSRWLCSTIKPYVLYPSHSLPLLMI